jgi:hypothetical protein
LFSEVQYDFLELRIQKDAFRPAHRHIFNFAAELTATDYPLILHVETLFPAAITVEMQVPILSARLLVVAVEAQ